MSEEQKRFKSSTQEEHDNDEQHRAMGEIGPPREPFLYLERTATRITDQGEWRPRSRYHHSDEGVEHTSFLGAICDRHEAVHCLGIPASRLLCSPLPTRVRRQEQICRRLVASSRYRL